MYAKLAFTDGDSPSRRRIQRLRFARSGKHMDVKDVKVALDIIIRPSLQLLKLAVGGRSVLPALKRPSKSLNLGDNVSSTSSLTPKKKVRFDEQPVTISRRGFFARYRKDSTPSPVRSCLIIRERDDTIRHKFAKHQPGPEIDSESVYEDCLSDCPGLLVDIQLLEGDADTQSQKCLRRSDFYETESGIATFDRTGYANYCLSRWLDKKHEEARSPTKLVFEDPALLPWPSRTLSPPPADISPKIAHPMFPQPRLVSRPPRSLQLRIWKRMEDELQNAIVVLIVGLFIHLCLFLFLLYDILMRGLTPSDD